MPLEPLCLMVGYNHISYHAVHTCTGAQFPIGILELPTRQDSNFEVELCSSKCEGCIQVGSSCLPVSPIWIREGRSPLPKTCMS